MPAEFSVRVYYEDTDFSGNVYHAAFLKFFERARTEFLRDRGVHHSDLAKDGMGFVVRRMNISFDRPAHIDDLLAITTVVTAVKGASLIMDQVARRGTTTLAQANVTVAMVGSNGRPLRLPGKLRQAL